MFKYLEIVKKETKEIVKRMDITNQSERQIERIEMGVLMNLNIKEYYIKIATSETKLERIG